VDSAKSAKIYTGLVKSEDTMVLKTIAGKHMGSNPIPGTSLADLLEFATCQSI
jgi:hypothetical protein